jgi:hypothetical protein
MSPPQCKIVVSFDSTVNQRQFGINLRIAFLAKLDRKKNFILWTRIIYLIFLCRLEQKKKQLAVSDLLAEAGEHLEF